MKKTLKKLTLFMAIALTLIFSNGLVAKAEGDYDLDPIIEIQAHVQDRGWMGWQHNGVMVGTTGQGLRMEAIQIRLKAPYTNDKNLHIQYRVHVQNKGWMPWVKDGGTAGTVGEALRIEAIQIKVVDNNGNLRSDYRVGYYAHVQNIGWTGSGYDGQTVGTVGQELRMEAICIGVEKIK
ncbi:Ig domain-containing protein [Clostridium intestinale]|uniref:ChW repeat-containing metalloprotease n=1 Tax=Clostridium intestinale URNW TaxID=1294142 RepID=U2Q1U0_9CLOT|nr:Ig domain-containing protein [Clostridium intestinale]ERK30019.1 ChW repeat-containing metalloprotease [Clostridium intestinale URNW]